MAPKTCISITVVNRPSVQETNSPAFVAPAKYLTHFALPVPQPADGARMTGHELVKKITGICQDQFRTDPNLIKLAQGDMTFHLDKPVDQDAWPERSSREEMRKTIESFNMDKVIPIETWDEITGPQIIIAVMSLPPPRTASSSAGASERYQSTLKTINEAEKSQEQLRDEIEKDARRDTSTPSAGAKLSHRITTQGRHNKWYNSRPASLGGPPIFIYEEAFSTFVTNMHDHQPNQEELEAAYEFVNEALEMYPLEKTRLNTLKEAMRKLMGLTEIEQEFELDVKIKPDGARTCEGRTYLPPLSGILELKNEPGEGGCDATAQAECDYAAVVLSKKALPIRRKSACPAFLVAMSGPYISVSGAVYTEGLISQPLTDNISIIPRLGVKKKRSAMDDTVYRVAKLFFALKTGIDALDDKYFKLVKNLPRAPPLADTGIAGTSLSANTQELLPTRQDFIGPHFYMFLDQAGYVVELQYIRRYLEPFQRTVFLANAIWKNGQSKLVIVKFAYRYNAEAHRILAAHEPSLAPELLYSEERDDLAGLTVVIMEYFTASSAHAFSEVQIGKLRTAVTLLHRNGLVFGDLRDPNILTDDKDTLMLIDFDWCGPENSEEATYPSDILLLDNKFHPEVVQGGRMWKQHDAFRFKSLTGQDLDRP